MDAGSRMQGRIMGWGEGGWEGGWGGAGFWGGTLVAYLGVFLANNHVSDDFSVSVAAPDP